MITNQRIIWAQVEGYLASKNERHLSDIEFLLNEYKWESFKRGY